MQARTAKARNLERNQQHRADEDTDDETMNTERPPQHEHREDDGAVPRGER